MDSQHIYSKEELQRYYRAGLLPQKVATNIAKELGYNAFFVIDTKRMSKTNAPRMVLHKAV